MYQEAGGEQRAAPDASDSQSASSPSPTSRLLDYRSKYKIKSKPVESAGTAPFTPPGSGPPMPSLPPFQPPPVAAAEVWRCRMCGHLAATEPLFQAHLTTAHFRDRIIRRIRPPYRCLLCDYVPPAALKDPEKVEDLLMHYGTTEKISVKFYENTCSEKAEEDRQQEANSSLQQQQPEPAKEHQSFDCRICDLSPGDERNLLKHLTLRHFPKQLCDDLPKKFPFRCPFIDCHQTRQNLHGLMLHYGVDHVISMELYMKHPKYRESQSGVSNSCSPVQGPSGTGSRVELPATPPRPTKLQAVVTPYHPETEEKGPPAGQLISSPQLVGSTSTGSSAGPAGSSARARILKTWQTGSHEGCRKTIEEMEAKIKDLETAHKEKLKEKEKEFERWLTLKESKLEAEVTKRKSLEESLADKELCVGDLSAQLELVHDNFSRVEEELDAKKRLCDDLLSYKEESLKELQVKEEERLNSYEELYQKEKQLEGIEEKLAEQESCVQKLTQQIQEKEAAFSEVEISVFNLNSEVSKLSSEFDQKTNLVKEKQGKSLKVVITRDGFTSRSVKKFKAMSSDVKESDLQQLPQDADEKKSLKEIFLQLQSSYKGFHEALQAKDQEISHLEVKFKESEFKAKDLEAKTDVLKALEKEKKDLTKKLKSLETTLADWETRQFTNVKLIAGLEKERDSLQAKLKEMQDGNLTHEDQLYWKDVAIKNKEKEVKSLKSAVEEKEQKIADLEKAEEESAALIKAVEGKNSQLEDRISTLEVLVQKSTAEVEDLKKQVVNQTNEIKHLKISLSQKTTELSSINTTAICQKAELDRLMRENEKFESDYSRAITQLEIVKNSKKDLLKKLQLKELNLQAMKGKLTDLVAREKAREEDRLEMEMRNQVLLDMDRVIQIQTRESQSGITVKEEPRDPTEGLAIATHSITADDEIVLNVSSAGEVIDVIKSELVDDDDSDEFQPSAAAADVPALIIPWPAFVPVGSHPELAGQRRKRKSPGAAAAATGTSPAITGADKRSRSRLEDVTALYSEEDMDENQVVCGICESWDPPVVAGKAAAAKNTTEWVGCDCGRWFHKTCTKLKRVTHKFSCKSVKKDCLTEIQV